MTQYSQDNIIKNVDLIVDTFAKYGNHEFHKLRSIGVCDALSTYYFKYVRKGKRDQYINYLKIMAALTPEDINKLVHSYQIDKDNCFVEIQLDTEIIKVPFQKILNLFKKIQKFNYEKDRKEMGHWESTYTIACRKDSESIRLYLTDALGTENNIFYVLIGMHQFCIEKVEVQGKSAYYLFDPTNFDNNSLIFSKLELAKSILNNIDFMVEYDTLLFSFQRFGHNAHVNLDNAIKQYEIDSINPPRSLQNAFKIYRNGEISSYDLVFMLEKIMTSLHDQFNNDHAFMKFFASISDIINQDNIKDEHEKQTRVVKHHRGLINNPAYINKISWLSLAVLSNQYHLAEILLDKGADPTFENKKRSTALYLAASNGNENMVKLLLDKESDPDHANYQGSIPLAVAIQAGDLGTIEVLANATKNINSPAKVKVATFLNAAAERNRHGELETLIRSKNAGELPESINNFTPLHLAVFLGDVNIATLLLNKNVDIYAETNGISAFDIAHVMNNDAVLRVLIQNEYKRESELGFPNIRMFGIFYSVVPSHMRIPRTQQHIMK